VGLVRTTIISSFFFVANFFQGKSALTSMFVDNQFLDIYEPTIEYTFRTTLIRNQVRFVCDILDTSAQDEYSTLSRQACLGVHGYILVYR